MRKILLITIVMLCMVSPAKALTYGASNYLDNIAFAGNGDKDFDPIYLTFLDIENSLDGTTGVASIVYTPGTEPSTPVKGMLYYDLGDNGLRLYTGSAFVNVDVSGASSLGTAYTVGSKISAGTLEVEIEVADSSNNPALRLDFDDATTNAQDVLIIDNAGDDADAVSIQINGTAGDDIRGTGDAYGISYLGVARFVGVTLGSTDLVFTEPTTNDVTLLADGDGILTISAGSMEDLDINLATANTLTLTSSTAVDKVNWGALDAHSGLNTLAFDVAVANSITQAGTGATDDLTIEQTASGVDASLILQSTGTGTDALSLISSVADISLVSADNITRTAADNITDVTTDGAYTLTIGGSTNGKYISTVADTYSLISVDALTIQNTEAAKNITVNSVAGSIYIEAEEDAASAVLITADGGTSSTLKIHNDTGTAATSIDIVTDVGGITNTASAGAIVLSAVGGTAGDVTVSAGDILTLTSVDTKIFDGAAAETWIVEGTADVHEASIVFTDPTADVVYTFPVAAASTLSVMTSTLATNAPDIANSVTGGTSTLIFEGAAVDAHEHTITATDPTADVVWTLPDGGASTVSFMASTLATNFPEIANSVTGGTNQLIYEGTVDAHEIVLTAADATADVLYTLPDAAAATYGIVPSSLAANGVDIVNSVTGGTAVMVFEGTADAFETSLGAVDATADVTLTLADDTGGIAYIPPASTTKDATDAALPLTHAVVIGTSDATSSWSLPDGNPGQVLCVVIGTDAGAATITPDSVTGAGFATVILSDAADGVTFMFVDATVGWVILGTFSDGTNIVEVTQ